MKTEGRFMVIGQVKGFIETNKKLRMCTSIIKGSVSSVQEMAVEVKIEKMDCFVKNWFSAFLIELNMLFHLPFTALWKTTPV